MIRIAQWNITIAYAFDSTARSDAARKYEERVRIAVNAIMRTHTGRVLLGTFRHPYPSKDASLWITPYKGTGDQYCNSRTGALMSTDVTTGQQNYEGVRIQYSPERWAVDDCGWYPGMNPEQVLFHEMVHASRGLNDPAYDDTDLDVFGDYEEFLAVLITNMFRSELGAKKLHRDYVYKLLVDQREAEVFLSSKRRYIDALESLLDDQLVAAMTQVNTPFNPFRDFARLQADHSDILEILDSITSLGGLREQARLQAIGKKLQEQRDMSINSSSKVIQHR